MEIQINMYNSIENVEYSSYSEETLNILIAQAYCIDYKIKLDNITAKIKWEGQITSLSFLNSASFSDIRIDSTPKKTVLTFIDPFLPYRPKVFKPLDITDKGQH